MKDEHRENLAAALRSHHRALVVRRKIPEPYTTIAGVMDAVEQRVRQHPRGLAGVADELGANRKSLWSWLRGMKIPDDANLAKLAAIAHAPILSEQLRIEVQSGVPIPPPRRGYRFSGKPKSQWDFVSNLKPDDFFQIDLRLRSSLTIYTKKHGIKITTRILSRDKLGVWVVTTP